MRDLASEMRRERELHMRREYRDVHPSEWPVDNPDWGSSRFELWGGPKWESERAEAVHHGFTARQIRRAAHEVRQRLDRHPTQVEVACATHE